MEWLISLLVPAIITVITLIVTNKIQQSRLPYQNNADRADANSKTMEAYEFVVGRLEIVEKENFEIKQSINGTLKLNLEIPLSKVFKEGKVPITGTAEILKTP